MKFKQQAVLSEERLKQVEGLEGEQWDLKIQLKTLTVSRVFREILDAVFLTEVCIMFCLHLLYVNRLPWKIFRKSLLMNRRVVNH